MVLASVCLAAAARWSWSMDFPSNLPPDTPREGSPERDALADFQRDPAANARAIRQLGAGPLQKVAVLMLLAGADADLRAGHYRAATRLFREVVARDPGPPWTEYAELGMGWTDLVRGSYASSERHYAAVRDGGPDVRLIAQTMRGWLAGVRGDYPTAMTLLDGASNAPEASYYTAQVATLGAGYARYWARRYREARSIFQQVAARWPDGALADDARYAAAWSLLQSGDLTGAFTELTIIAGPSAGKAPEHLSHAAIDLAPKAVIRAGRGASARASGLAPPDARMVSAFDGDGAALARAALRILDRSEPTEGGTAAVPVDSTASDPHSRLTDAGSAPRPTPRVSPVGTDGGRKNAPAGYGPWAAAVLLVLALAYSLARRRRVGGA